MDAKFALLGTSPIPGENPAGMDARYEPEYGAVLAEIEKLSFSGQGSVASWTEVETNATVILANKSKDFQIAAYLAVALLHTMGMQGLLTGALVLDGISREFWQTAYPPPNRMRGRINAINWWRERAYAYLQRGETQNNIDPSLTTKILGALSGCGNWRPQH